MTQRIARPDFDRLERDGFAALPGLLAGFEREVAISGAQLQPSDPVYPFLELTERVRASSQPAGTRL